MLLQPNTLDAIKRCKSIDHISRLCQAHLMDHGFRHIAYVRARSLQSAPEDWIVSTTYPREWQLRYLKRSYAEVDPVYQACARTLLPVDWSKLDGDTKEARMIFGEAADYGIGRTGISIPLFSPDGSFSITSYTADQQTDDWQPHSATLASLTLLAMYCHARIDQLIEPCADNNLLTPRETECLSWSASGKSMVEVARLMEISERTVRFHLENVREKLGTQTTLQTVSKAVALGLIRMH
jgi:DNA-binding CsgD family transcriptional regulator